MRTTRYAKLLTSPLGPEGSLRAHLRDRLGYVLARPHMHASTPEALEVQVLILLEALDFPGAPEPEGGQHGIESVQNRWLRFVRDEREIRDNYIRGSFSDLAAGLRAFAAQERAREAP